MRSYFPPPSSGELSSASTGGYAVRITPNISPTYGGNNVNHGYFFDDTVLTNETGIFFWEAWVMPEAEAFYVISDGHGGNHKLLFGFAAGDPLNISGNIRNDAGAVNVTFTSIDAVPANTLQHIAVSWDGAVISTWLNGVRSSSLAYTGDRGNDGSSGTLYVGGSDHNNFKGWIFRVRGFEGLLPFPNGLPNNVNYFIPERIFRGSFRNGNTQATEAPSFLADYTTPSQIIADYSQGHDGATHPGVLSVGNDDGIFAEGLKNFEPYLPTFDAKDFEQTAYSGTAPSSTPVGALLFDEFRRVDIVPAWYNTSAWPAITAPTGQAWSTNVGILCEKLYALEQSAITATISHVQADIDITFTNGNLAISPDVIIRRTDANNYLVVNIQNFGGPLQVTLTEVVAGTPSVIDTSADVGSTQWTTFRIVADGANVDVYRNGVLVIDDATVSITTGTVAGFSMGALTRLDKIEAYAP